MSKNRNTKARSAEIQSFSQRIVDQAQHDSAPPEVASAMRKLWQKQVEAKFSCTPFTARSHVAQALRRLRHTSPAGGIVPGKG